MPQPSNNNKLAQSARYLAAGALQKAANFISGEAKAFTGDGGWYSWGGGGSMGGLLGPAGASQSNLTVSRFRNTAEHIGAYVAVDSIYDCVQARAKAMAKLKKKLKHLATGTIVELGNERVQGKAAANNPLFRDEREWVRYRELATLLRRPNPYQSWFEFMALCQVYFDLAGNSLILQDNPNGLDWPEFLWSLNPAWTEPMVDPAEALIGYRYTSGVDIGFFEPEDVLHAKEINPGSLFWGLSKIMVLAGVADTEMAIDEYQRGFFTNGAVLSGVVQAPNRVDPKTFKQLKAEIKNQFQGVRNHFKVALLTNGLTWQNVSLSQTDMGLIDWKNLNTDRVLKAYGVPKSKLGQQDDAQYNKLDAADRMFYGETVTPLSEMWQDIFSDNLTCRYGYELIFEVPRFEDVQNQVTIAKEIDSLNSLTPWEKRQTIKKIFPSVVLEDDPDSPYNSGGKPVDSPALHRLYKSDGTTLAELSTGDNNQNNDTDTLPDEETLIELIEAILLDDDPAADGGDEADTDREESEAKMLPVGLGSIPRPDAP